MTFTELTEDTKVESVGGGATLRPRWRRFGLEGLVAKARMKPIMTQARLGVMFGL
jgi:hypothetical protein